MSERDLAARWRRFAAICIDVLLVALLAVGIMLVSGIMESAEAYVGAQSVYRILAVVCISFVLLNAWLLAGSAQTVGKKILKIQIVGKNSGEKPGILALLLRSCGILLILLVPSLYLWFIGLFLLDHLAIFGKSRRCMHDYVFGSIVVSI